MDRDETPIVTVTATPYQLGDNANSRKNIQLEGNVNSRLSLLYVGEITAEVIYCSYANFENFKNPDLELKKT